jgi:hypothetical protein
LRERDEALGLSSFEGLRVRELGEGNVEGEGEKEREKIKKIERKIKYN